MIDFLLLATLFFLTLIELIILVPIKMIFNMIQDGLRANKPADLFITLMMLLETIIMIGLIFWFVSILNLMYTAMEG